MPYEWRRGFPLVGAVMIAVRRTPALERVVSTHTYHTAGHKEIS